MMIKFSFCKFIIFGVLLGAALLVSSDQAEAAEWYEGMESSSRSVGRNINLASNTKNYSSVNAKAFRDQLKNDTIASQMTRAQTTGMGTFRWPDNALASVAA